MPLYSVGHSTRTLDELLALLQENGVEVLADVRTVPGSRRLPQFGRSSLQSALPVRGLAYVHLPELGGYRKPRPDSRNTAWRNQSFRGYADYMETPEFRAGLERLIGLQARGVVTAPVPGEGTPEGGVPPLEDPRGERSVAMLCAEAVPWRCHRNLVSDALLARGVVVRHILGPGDVRPHSFTPFARVDGTDTSYPGLDTLPFNG
jgi:uncharacterized protein (DUF488 family)